jgi:hypothetical protein
MSGKTVKSFNVTKTAEGNKSGATVTAIAAAVFIAVIGLNNERGNGSAR